MSIEDYLAGLTTQSRKRVGRLLELISNIAPQAEASMKYKMPAYLPRNHGPSFFIFLFKPVPWSKFF